MLARILFGNPAASWAGLIAIRAADVTLSHRADDATSLSRHVLLRASPIFRDSRAETARATYTVVVGTFVSPSSSPRFLARYAETLARFMHRSEQ